MMHRLWSSRPSTTSSPSLLPVASSSSSSSSSIFRIFSPSSISASVLWRRSSLEGWRSFSSSSRRRTNTSSSSSSSVRPSNTATLEDPQTPPPQPQRKKKSKTIGISQREERPDTTGSPPPKTVSTKLRTSEHLDLSTPHVARWQMLRRDFLETNNEGLGFDPKVLEQKQEAERRIRDSDKSIIQDLVESDPELVDEYLKVVDLRRVRRDFFWQNRAAISQRLKYDRLKAEIREIRSRIEARNQERGGEKKYFGIQDVIQLLGADPGNEMAVYDISSISNVNDYEVVITAASVRHMRHISYTLYKMAKSIGVSQADSNIVKIQGRDSNEWVMVDCGEIMIHFFLEHSRKSHDIERRWKEHLVPPERYEELQDSHVRKCTVMVHLGQDSLWEEDFGSDWENEIDE